VQEQRPGVLLTRYSLSLYLARSLTHSLSLSLLPSVCVYAHPGTHTRVCINTRVCVCMNTHKYAHTHVLSRLYTSPFTAFHLLMCVPVHTHTHTHVYVCEYTLVYADGSRRHSGVHSGLTKSTSTFATATVYAAGLTPPHTPPLSSLELDHTRARAHTHTCEYVHFLNICTLESAALENACIRVHMHILFVHGFCMDFA